MSEQPRAKRSPLGTFICCLGFAGTALIGAPTLGDSAGIMNPTPFKTTDGRQIYEHVCRGCHMQDAHGAIGAGHYPALAKDPALASRQFVALTILMGRRNMPAFGARHAIGFGGPPAVLSEEQIAAVINYVRSHFDNHYKDQISAAEVKALDQNAH